MPKARADVDSGGAQINNVVVNAPINGDWSTVLALFNLDPAEFEVVDDTVRMSTWQQSARSKDGDRDSIQLYSYSARFRRVTRDMVPVETVKRWRSNLLRAVKPSARRSGSGTYLMLVADPQIGKKRTEDAVANWKRGVLGHLAEIQRLTDLGLPPAAVHVAFMGDETEGFASNYCVGADELVLRKDMQWVPAGSLRAGDELYTIEEEPANSHGGRRFTPGTVLRNEVRELPALRVSLSDGRTLVCTPEHPLLVRRLRKHRPATWRWVKASDMMAELAGNSRRVGPKSATPFEVMSISKPWSRDDSRDGGWFGGILDGEGCFSRGTDRVSGSLSFAQKEGVVLSKALSILDGHGFTYTVDKRDSGVCSVNINGGHLERMRALGVFAPHRLVPKVTYPFAYSSTGATEHPQVTSIEDAGMQRIAVMGTSSRTYFANGLASHNTNQAHTIELNQAAQLELAYDLMVWTIKQALSTGLRVSASAVISNHGEWTRLGGKDPITSAGDNASTHLARQVKRLFDELADLGGPKVEWTIGEGDPAVTVTLSGVRCYFTHGYVEKGRGTSSETRTRAAIERQILGRTADLGDVPLWYFAHYHHAYSNEFEGRTVWGCPALEAERSSEYMLNQFGVWSPPGMLGMLVGGSSGRRWSHAVIH